MPHLHKIAEVAIRKGDVYKEMWHLAYYLQKELTNTMHLDMYMLGYRCQPT